MHLSKVELSIFRLLRKGKLQFSEIKSKLYLTEEEAMSAIEKLQERNLIQLYNPIGTFNIDYWNEITDKYVYEATNAETGIIQRLLFYPLPISRLRIFIIAGCIMYAINTANDAMDISVITVAITTGIVANWLTRILKI